MKARLRALARAFLDRARVRRSVGESGPEDLRYVFIVTYGRSGSTLLQGVLNSLPGYLIRGENRNAVYHLFQFHQTCVRERARTNRQSGRDPDSPDSTANPTHPFFGIGGYPGGKAVADIRRLAVDTLLRPGPDTRVSGFKEIRWYQPDVLDYVAFLQRVFPGARFVVNTRNHADVARSGWWAEQDNAEEVLARIESGILDLAERLGDQAYRVHFDDYVADPSRLEGLVHWLGEEYDAATIADVLEVQHSRW